MPNDSPSSAGKHAMSARRSRSAFWASLTRPSHSTCGTPRAQSLSRWGPSPAIQRSASRSRSAKASRSTAAPLRGSSRPTKKMVGRVVVGVSPCAKRSTSTPFGTISHCVAKVSSTWRAAWADTAVATVRRRSSGRNGDRNVWYHGFRPWRAEWNVPTAGIVVPTSAAWLAPGLNGSCRCSTSGSKVFSASIVRRATARPAATGATDPLLGSRVLGPTVTMPGSGGGPSHGAMTRASTPRRRSACTRPSTCACTPPKSDRE